MSASDDEVSFLQTFYLRLGSAANLASSLVQIPQLVEGNDDVFEGAIGEFQLFPLDPSKSCNWLTSPKPFIIPLSVSSRVANLMR